QRQRCGAVAWCCRDQCWCGTIPVRRRWGKGRSSEGLGRKRTGQSSLGTTAPPGVFGLKEYFRTNGGGRGEKMRRVIRYPLSDISDQGGREEKPKTQAPAYGGPGATSDLVEEEKK